MLREIPQGPESRRHHKNGAIFDKNAMILRISLLSLAVYLRPKMIVNLGRTWCWSFLAYQLGCSLAESPGLPLMSIVEPNGASWEKRQQYLSQPRDLKESGICCSRSGIAWSLINPISLELFFGTTTQWELWRCCTNRYALITALSSLIC